MHKSATRRGRIDIDVKVRFNSLGNHSPDTNSFRAEVGPPLDNASSSRTSDRDDTDMLSVAPVGRGYPIRMAGRSTELQSARPLSGIRPVAVVRSHHADRRGHEDAKSCGKKPQKTRRGGCRRPRQQLRQKAEFVTALAARPDLNAMFVEDLGPDAVVEGEPVVKPIMATLAAPLPLAIQVYLWLATAPFERQTAAHKIQITLPGATRGERIHIPRHPGRLVLFGGFAVQFDTWILWDAELFMAPEGISYSRNLQVPVDALTNAVAHGLVVANKRVRETVIGSTTTTIVVCRRSHLVAAIGRRFQLGIERQLES